MIQKSQLGIYPREIKAYAHTDLYFWMFKATLLIIDQNW